MKRLIGGVVTVLGLLLLGCAEPVPQKTFEEIQDCEDCPVMVVIPPGEFLMGAPPQDNLAQEWERPQKRINIEQGFAMGKFEITSTQYRRCVQAGACVRGRDKLFDSDSPITNIEWRHAYSYVAWLSKKTGRQYWLPSSAEWEYAARGGTSTIYWWGDEEEYDNEYCTGCNGGSIRRNRPTQVGRFRPNPFGLYDMLGNAAEFVGTCAEAKYEDFPAELPLLAEPNSCERHEFRGADSKKHLSELRLSRSWAISEDLALKSIGFRVAAELEP